MVKQANSAETILDDVRRALGKAKTASDVLEAGSSLPALTEEVENNIFKLDEQIAAEAESIDRSRANRLRSEKNAFSDLLTDIEYLAKRIDDRHKTLTKSETETAMSALQAKGLANRNAIYRQIAALEGLSTAE